MPSQLSEFQHKLSEFTLGITFSNLEKYAKSYVGLTSGILLMMYLFSKELYQVKEWKSIFEKYLTNQSVFKTVFISFQLSDTQPSSPSDFISAIFLVTKILERGQWLTTKCRIHFTCGHGLKFGKLMSCSTC